MAPRKYERVCPWGLILKDLGEKWRWAHFPFCLSWPGHWDISLENRGQQNKENLFWNMGLRHLLQSLSAFLLLYGTFGVKRRIIFKSSLDPCTFMLWLSDYFDLSRYSVRLLMVYVAWGDGSCSARGTNE